jgi:hypothetical protein
MKNAIIQIQIELSRAKQYADQLTQDLKELRSTGSTSPSIYDGTREALLQERAVARGEIDGIRRALNLLQLQDQGMKQADPGIEWLTLVEDVA